MQPKRIIVTGTVFLSLLLSITPAQPLFSSDVTEFDNETTDEIEQGTDLYLDDTEYDYEEVGGEDAVNNVIPFRKYPGVYVLDLDGVLYALDAESGDIIWERKVSDRLMKVTEARSPPSEYGGVGNSTSVQCTICHEVSSVAIVSEPFTEMLVSLDGYILLPRVDGKFSVFQHSIDNIINKDTVVVDLPQSEGDQSLLFMGGKKSSFITVDAVTGKIAGFKYPYMSDIRVIRVEKSVNCFSSRGFEYWNLTTTTVSLQFSHETMRHLSDIPSVAELIYSDALTIRAFDESGNELWHHRFNSMPIQSYYANNNVSSFVRSHTDLRVGSQHAIPSDSRSNGRRSSSAGQRQAGGRSCVAGLHLPAVLLVAPPLVGACHGDGTRRPRRDPQQGKHALPRRHRGGEPRTGCHQGLDVARLSHPQYGAAQSLAQLPSGGGRSAACRPDPLPLQVGGKDATSRGAACADPLGHAR